VLGDDAIADEEDAEAADEAALAEITDGGDEIKAADVDEDEIDAELAEELGEDIGDDDDFDEDEVCSCAHSTMPIVSLLRPQLSEM